MSKGELDSWLDTWATLHDDGDHAEADRIRLRVLGGAVGGDLVMRLLREVAALRYGRNYGEVVKAQVDALCEVLDELEDNLDA